MNEKTKTPIGSLADLLAEMTERAMEAERQRDAAKEEAGNWYQYYHNQTEMLTETRAALHKKIEENEKLKNKIEEYIERMERIFPEDQRQASTFTQGGADNA